MEDGTKRGLFSRHPRTYTSIYCSNFRRLPLPQFRSVPRAARRTLWQTFTRRIIFNFPQFPVPQKDRYETIFLPPSSSLCSPFTFLFNSRTEVEKFTGKAERMEVIYRNGVSRTDRSPARLMLTSSSLSSSSFSFPSPFSLRPPRRLFIVVPHTARSTQTGKFRRCGNYVSRGLNFRLRREYERRSC